MSFPAPAAGLKAQPIMALKVAHQFPSLDAVTRPTVDTAAAAYYLNRRPQTMRSWASRDDGPLRPLRVHGRLAWPVAGIKAVLGVA